MGLYEEFINNVTVTFQESVPDAPKLIHIDEHRCYFEGSPNVIFNTSLTDPGTEHAVQVIKNVAYKIYVSLLQDECRKMGIDENSVF